MAANRFDQAAEMPIINTYVPIDFKNLYMIGATQKAAVDQAIADIGDAVQAFGEFTSPSDIDTENYYNLSLGQMNDLITEASTDPDKLKDAGFRARFYGRLNSLDYAELSRLKEGADALRAREQNVARMIANNTYYENWDQYRDLSNYDTLKKGILDELAPIAYRSMFDLASPYVENMKPTFFKGKAPNSGVSMPYTNWMAITPEMRARELNAHLSDIIATPQGKMHLQEIRDMYPNANDAEIMDIFMNQLMTVTSYKDIETPVADQYGMQMAIIRAKSGVGQATSPITARTSEIKSQAAKQILDNTNTLARMAADAGLISSADPSQMTENDVTYITAQVVGALRTEGLAPQFMFATSPAEYQRYHNSTTAQLTDKNGDTPDSWGESATIEQYGFRNGDKIFTEDGKELPTIPANIFVDDSPSYIDMNRVLRRIAQDQAGFQVNAGSNSFMYNDSDDLDASANVVKTLGRLYVTEKALEEAIKQTYPELDGWIFGKTGALIDYLEEGFEENGHTYHRVLQESKDRKIDGQDTYVFMNVARNIGDVGSQNSNFNFDIAKDRTTGGVVSENWNPILGSSFQ